MRSNGGCCCEIFVIGGGCCHINGGDHSLLRNLFRFSKATHWCDICNIKQQWNDEWLVDFSLFSLSLQLKVAFIGTWNTSLHLKSDILVGVDAESEMEEVTSDFKVCQQYWEREDAIVLTVCLMTNVVSSCPHSLPVSFSLFSL